jgi:hypothetical protein
MSSLLKYILHELLCFQELSPPNLKKLKSRVSENQVSINIEEKERHLKVELTQNIYKLKQAYKITKYKQKLKKVEHFMKINSTRKITTIFYTIVGFNNL